MMENSYLKKIIELLGRLIITDQYGNPVSYSDGLQQITDILRDKKRERGTVYLCGNGGSAGIAQHMTADFLKNGGILTCSLYGQPTLTCISNDLSYEYVFCKQLELMAKPGELLVAISSSGESENIVKAIETIRRLKGNVITFTGFKDSNRIRGMGDFNVYVPVEHYGMVESIHNIILQQIVDCIVDMDGVALQI